jgi:hypothetical protein
MAANAHGLFGFRYQKSEPCHFFARCFWPQNGLVAMATLLTSFGLSSPFEMGIPAGWVGRAGEIGDAVVVLASSAGSFINVVDGGQAQVVAGRL